VLSPWVVVISLVVLAGTALFAGIVPARLAARADPSIALRSL
jgi:ABC-type antimicrobial peptide transport system permease subunit